MRALTLWPEWAWAICRLGKRIENRGYPLRNDLRQTGLAIHAGKLIGGTAKPHEQLEALDALAEMAKRAGWTRSPPDFTGNVTFTRGDTIETLKRSTIPCGAIVALCRVERSTDRSRDPWAAPGQHNWELSEVVELAHPVVCRGQQMIWTVPTSTVLAIQNEMAGARVLR